MSRFAQIFEDGDGDLSSKRVAAFASFACFIGAGCVNTFTTFVTPEIYATALRDITIAGLLLSVPELFSTAKAQSSSTTTTTETTIGASAEGEVASLPTVTVPTQKLKVKPEGKSVR